MVPKLRNSVLAKSQHCVTKGEGQWELLEDKVLSTDLSGQADKVLEEESGA